MKAVQFQGFKQFPQLVEIEKPIPGPGEVLLKVAAAGACHSDVAIFHEYEKDPAGLLTPPFVLGHENTGWVEELGQGVTNVSIGHAYAVYGPIGCNQCQPCARGEENYCTQKRQVGHLAVGLGRDGGMAEYMTVPAHHLVPLGDADPVAAAPLTDAGLTPYHAIKRALPHLQGGGKTALVIGLGGLGYIAVQILKALTGATVIATDMKQEAMDDVKEFGVLTVSGGENQVEEIRALTHGQGVDAVFDFVGIAPTLKLAPQVVATGGSITVVGIAGGTFEWNFYGLPYEVNFSSTYWGSISDLHEVIQMYRQGQIKTKLERFTLDEALTAYEKLRDGKLSGRAVVVPHPEMV